MNEWLKLYEPQTLVLNCGFLDGRGFESSCSISDEIQTGQIVFVDESHRIFLSPASGKISSLIKNKHSAQVVIENINFESQLPFPNFFKHGPISIINQLGVLVCFKKLPYGCSPRPNEIPQLIQIVVPNWYKLSKECKTALQCAMNLLKKIDHCKFQIVKFQKMLVGANNWVVNVDHLVRLGSMLLERTFLVPQTLLYKKNKQTQEVIKVKTGTPLAHFLLPLKEDGIIYHKINYHQNVSFDYSIGIHDQTIECCKILKKKSSSPKKVEKIYRFLKRKFPIKLFKTWFSKVYLKIRFGFSFKQQNFLLSTLQKKRNLDEDELKKLFSFNLLERPILFYRLLGMNKQIIKEIIHQLVDERNLI